jgi:hypothetical protein
MERQPVQAGDLQRKQRCRETLAEAGNQPCSQKIQGSRRSREATGLPGGRHLGFAELGRFRGCPGEAALKALGASAPRVGELALQVRDRRSIPSFFTRGCSARSQADTDFPGSARTSKRQGVSGSLSGWGKSVSAPRTLMRGSRDRPQGWSRSNGATSAGAARNEKNGACDP